MRQNMAKKQKTDEAKPTTATQAEVEKLEQQIKEAKKQLKALKQDFTFRGLYRKLSGRDNILRELKKDKSLEDVEKYDKAVEIIIAFAQELQDKQSQSEE